MSSEKKRSKQHTEEEYKKAIKILKHKITNLGIEGHRLQDKYEKKIKNLNNKFSSKNDTNSEVINLALTLEDDKLYKPINYRVNNNNNDKRKKIYDFQPYENERLLRIALNELQQVGLNYEMVFRCIDQLDKQSIGVQQIEDFLCNNIYLERLNFNEIRQLSNLFDEDCNGDISWNEYKQVLCSYSVNLEGDYLTDARNSDKKIMEQILRFFKRKNISSYQMFEDIKSASNYNYITGQQIQKYFMANDLSIKQMELYSILRMMDPERKNQVKKMDFIREFDKIIKQKLDFEIEMKNFRNYFIDANIKPIQIFKLSDDNQSKKVSISKLAQTIAMHVKDLEEYHAQNYLNMIDIDKNGFIEQLEFELCLISEEDCDNIQIYTKDELSEQQEKKVIQNLTKKMDDLDLNNSGLFKRLDRNLSGEITLVELRAGLLDLGFNIHEVINIMRVFDKNLNGKIEVQEYVDIMSGNQKDKDELLKSIAQVDPNFEQDKKMLTDAVRKLRKVFIAYYPGLSLQHQKLFQNFDKNKDGVLNRQEFLEGLDSLQEKTNLNERQKYLLMNYVDKNQDNHIDFEEFADFLEHFQPENIRQSDIQRSKKLPPLEQRPTNNISQYFIKGHLKQKDEKDDKEEKDQKNQKEYKNDQKNDQINEDNQIQNQKEHNVFDEENDDKGVQQAGAVAVNTDKNNQNNQTNINNQKNNKNDDKTKQNQIAPDIPVLNKKKEINLNDSQLENQKTKDIENQQTDKSNLIEKNKSIAYNKREIPKVNVCVEFCVAFYLFGLFCVLIIWLFYLNENDGFERSMILKKKSIEDIQALYYKEKTIDEKDIAIIIYTHLNQYFPTIFDQFLILFELMLLVYIFDFDLRPRMWKYILNCVLLVKDALTIIWIFKEELADNDNEWTFAGYGYFLGRTFCSIPLFITLAKILTIRLYVFSRNPGFIIKFLLYIISVFWTICNIMACMHLTVGLFTYFIPVSPLWGAFFVLFFFFYRIYFDKFELREDVTDEEFYKVQKNEKQIFKYQSFSVNRLGYMSLQAMVLPQIVMAGSIISDQNANFPGFYQFFYSSCLQIMTNIFSTDTESIDVPGAIYRYLLGF